MKLRPFSIEIRKMISKGLSGNALKVIAILAMTTDHLAWVGMIGFTQMDLGIAKYHFEIRAGKENFEWA